MSSARQGIRKTGVPYRRRRLGSKASRLRHQEQQRDAAGN